MKTVLTYTVLSGDSLSAIALQISAAAGVSWQKIAKANPSIDPNRLSIGQIIDIPAKDGDKVLRYTVRSGDSLSLIASALAQCKSMTYQQILEDNPGVEADHIAVGQLLRIPATTVVSHSDDSNVLLPAENIGYWDWTWSSGQSPANATISLAFSGWSDIDSALQNSRRIFDKQTGSKYICIGGGNQSGAFTKEVLEQVTEAIESGLFADYDGIGYDVEEGDSGLAQAFAGSFAAAQSNGLRVLVTISHSAPFGVSDAGQLMQSFFNDENIDFISPQLYTTGKEAANDYDTSHGVTWADYAACKAKVIPSIVKDSYYPDAQSHFAEQGVVLAGYVQWQQV